MTDFVESQLKSNAITLNSEIKTRSYSSFMLTSLML